VGTWPGETTSAGALKVAGAGLPPPGFGMSVLVKTTTTAR